MDHRSPSGVKMPKIFSPKTFSPKAIFTRRLKVEIPKSATSELTEKSGDEAASLFGAAGYVPLHPHVGLVFTRMTPTEAYALIEKSDKKYLIRESSLGGYFTIDHPLSEHRRIYGGSDKSTRFAYFKGGWKIYHFREADDDLDEGIMLNKLSERNVDGLFQAMADCLVLPEGYKGSSMDYMLENLLIP
jgi:hypothetical protein